MALSIVGRARHSPLGRAMNTIEQDEFDADLWYRCENELGEGPLAHPGRGSLIWFDVLKRGVFERPFQGGEAREHVLDVMASAAALVDDRRVLLATEVDLRLFDLDAGTTKTVAPFLEREPGLRSNDGGVHPSGAFWISSMGKQAEPEAGAIWWFRDGDLRLLFDRITIPNAISFTPSGDAAYFADSTKRTVWRVPVEPETGLPTGEPVVFRQLRDEGAPDGAMVDAEGRLWIACWGGSAVYVWNSDGTCYDVCKLPVRQPSCPAFFGPNLDEIAVTTAREHMSADQLAAEPLAGSVFKLRRKVRGVAEPFVRIG